MSSLDSTTCSIPGPDQERLARILDDYLVAIERGLPITPEELLEKHPEDAAQLRLYLSGLQLFHAAAGDVPRPLQGATFTNPLPRATETLGDYRLVREIGRGGMGVVYEAFQVSLRRRVALKILPFTVASDAKQLSRFKNEAQAAAQVQHPNIVPVYAVGEENGVHYYVMQLIEGQSLTSLLNGLRLSGRQSNGATAANFVDLTVAWHQGQGVSSEEIASDTPVDEPVIAPMKAAETADHIRAVARLMQQAAGALHAAHEYGVVHRDVKPSNLLLDDQGKLWVTDFGLARCREQQGLTQTGDVLGTMRYMSPEQSLGRTALIDQRTDVYSLGITMYELATLRHPADGVSDIQLYFDRKNMSPRPLRQLNGHIPSDFQTIVLKCLAEFPHERYSTAKELADDLERYLDGRPIAASPPGLLTRASKWAKRRRGVVYATAAVLFVAIAGAVTSRMMLSHERTLASARELEQTKRFASGALETFNPTRYADRLAMIPGAEGVRHDMLQAGIEFFERYEKEVADDPALAADWARAQSNLGMLSEKLDNKQDAVAAHTKAMDVWAKRAARDPANADNARNLALAENNLAMVLSQEGRSAEALQLLTKARDSQVKLVKAEPTSNELAAELATTHGNVGLVLMQSGDKHEAIAEFDNSIRVGRQLVDASDTKESVLRSLAASYSNLGSLHDVQQPILAAEAYRNAIELQLKLVKADRINRNYQSDLARTYSNLGFLSSRTKDWKNAEICYDDAIRIQLNLVQAAPMAASYRRDLAISYNNLGMAQSRGGRFADAEDSFRKAIQRQEVLLTAQPSDGETWSNQGSAWNNLALVFDQQRRFADAEGGYQKAITNQRRALDSAPKNERYRALLSQHYLNSARNLEKQAKYDAALRAAVERKHLWQGNANRLHSAAQQLAGIYGVMRAAGAPQQLQAKCMSTAIEALRESVAAGLPVERLRDKSLTNLSGADEFRKLIDEVGASAAAPAPVHQAAER